jgi:flagellar biosynthesis/type III secretory pathway chaperone
MPDTDGKPKISSVMKDKEAIINRIEYFQQLLKQKEEERDIEYKENGISSRYKTLTNRMSQIRRDIEKWEQRLNELP